jgi:hypothetical protein
MTTKPSINYEVHHLAHQGLQIDVITEPPSVNQSTTPNSNNVIIELNGVKKRIRYSGEMTESVVIQLLQKHFSLPESLLQNKSVKVHFRQGVARQSLSAPLSEFLSKGGYKLTDKFTIQLEPISTTGNSNFEKPDVIRPQITTQFTADFTHFKNSKKSIDSIDLKAINIKQLSLDQQPAALETIKIAIPPLGESKQRRLSKAQESIQATAQFAHLQGDQSMSDRQSGFFASDSGGGLMPKPTEPRKYSQFGEVFHGQAPKLDAQPTLQIYQNPAYPSQSRVTSGKTGVNTKHKVYYSNQKELTMSLGTKKGELSKQLLKHQTVSQFQVNGGPLSPTNYQSLGSVASPGKSIDYGSEQVHSEASNQPVSKLIPLPLCSSSILTQVGRMSKVLVLHTMKTAKFLGKMLTLLPKFSQAPSFFTNQVDTYAEESLELSLNYEFALVLKCDEMPTLLSIFCEALGLPNSSEYLLRRLQHERGGRDLLVQAVSLDQMVQFVKMIDQNEEFQKEVLRIWGQQNSQAVEEISNVLELIFCFYKFRVSSIIRRYTTDIDLSNSGSQLSPQTVREAG